jgi:hypothetical protein
LIKRGLDSGFCEFPHLITACCDGKRFDVLEKVGGSWFSSAHRVWLGDLVLRAVSQVLVQLPVGSVSEADILPFAFKKLVDAHEFKAADKVCGPYCHDVLRRFLRLVTLDGRTSCWIAFVHTPKPFTRILCFHRL